MTGKETKVLQGYGSLANQHAKPEEDDNVKVTGMEFLKEKEEHWQTAQNKKHNPYIVYKVEHSSDVYNK